MNFKNRTQPHQTAMIPAVSSNGPSTPERALLGREDGRGGRIAGQGSTGNVIAALCSFFIHGLGQLLQGRLLMAIVQFVLAAVLCFVLLGWLIRLWSILDAALWKPRA